MASRLVVQEVVAGYGAVQVLHGVSLTVHEGETVILLGTNGNGKSTLLKCIMGLVRPAAGHIFLEVDGRRCDLVGRTPEEIVDLGVTLVPEGRRLFPKLSVEENLLLGAYRREARRDADTTLRYCFELFPVLAQRRRQLAGSLSGGEQQMLAIARALMSRPRFLLVDEPSVGLAPLLVRHVITQVKEMQQRYGLTVLMAEQNFHQATRIADRGYVLVEGRVVFEGASAAALGEHELVKKYYLGL
ncbi:MAG: ABC transporter ATP-binding protein [Candidatus Tectimicrobiota bacterium]|nr:MAG: ABC transporter ATP-binding protein [Candidatus Tectomicrobia bacterium]